MRMPLEIPPGLRRAATQHATGNGWYDMSLVRWNQERMQPIGGWQPLTGLQLTDAVRQIISWRANDALVYVAAASLAQIMVWQNFSAYQIQPSGFVGGQLAIGHLDGFGFGDFGEDLFGTPREISTGSYTPFGDPGDSVSLDTYGEDLIACGSADGRLLQWTPTPLTGAPPVMVPIPPAAPTSTEAAGIVHVVPTGCRAAFVTDERAVVAIGANGDPRRISWSDLERPGAWTPDITNLAGSQQLNSSGIALTARRVPQGYLIFTTEDVHLMSFVGPPFAYGISRVGIACGPVGVNAVATVLGHTAWIGRENLWQYFGVPVPLQCPFQGFIFDNLNRQTAGRSFVMANGVHPEIWFCYPDQNSTEPNRYVVWNFQTANWTAGALNRTAGREPQSYGLPLMGDASGIVRAHEQGWLADGNMRGSTVYAETGDIMLNPGGDFGMMIRAIIPDFVNQQQAQLHLFGSWEPEDGVLEDYGVQPYTRTDGVIDTLVEARAIRLRIEGLDQANAGQVQPWSLGRIALDVQRGSAR